jgi:opacity protein-like surface antigen
MHIFIQNKEFMMVKKIGIALLCVSLGSTLYARDDISESRPFIGLEIGYSTVQGDVGGFYPGEIIKDYEGSDIEFGVRLGAQKDVWRTTLSFNYFDGDEDGKKQNYEKGLASIDYFFLNSEENNFKPFLGANVGYINYESTDDIDMSGLIYGAQAGVVLGVTDNVDLDLMYRYTLSNATQDDRDTGLDHIGGVVFGINYIY